MTEIIASHIETFANFAQTSPWLLLFFIFLFMTIESSFIPFPSEVVMIPAGFLAWRYDLFCSSHIANLVIVVVVGLIGSMLGAYINYFLAVYLGRPFLHKFGKYFFLSESSLDRAEELFREYGEVVTFVSRLLPAIRQLISIPAGLSRMNFFRFSLFTALGAGIWSAILAWIGYMFGWGTGDMTYLEMVNRGKQMIADHYILIFVICAALFFGYIFLHKFIMKSKKKSSDSEQKNP